MVKQHDWSLLRRFVDSGSQDAFAELTQRYLGLVYGTCLRELQDPMLAEDATQAVFLILARKSSSFRPNVILAAWLFDACKMTANNMRRAKTRQQARDRKIAAERHRQEEATESDLRTIHSALDEALDALPRADRQAVLLHYLCGCTFQETGSEIGISEDAAQKRVSRAIEKMRAHLVKRGYAISGLVLIGLLHEEAARAVPAHCLDAVLPILPGLKISLMASSLRDTRAYHISQGVLTTMKAKTIITMAGTAVLALTSLSLLIAGGLPKNTVGTWTTDRIGSNKIVYKETVHLNQDGSFSMSDTYHEATGKLHSLLSSGTYGVKDGSITFAVKQAIVNGKSIPVLPKDTPYTKAKMIFSRDGKTLTLNFSDWKESLSRQ